MLRAGLVKRPCITRPPSHRLCVATSKRTKARCKRWALRGEKVCVLHGGRGAEVKRLKPGDPKRIALQAEVDRKAARRAATWQAKKQRLAAGLYPLHVGFQSERPQPRSLYDEFKSHHRPRSERIPDYER